VLFKLVDPTVLIRSFNTSVCAAEAVLVIRIALCPLNPATTVIDAPATFQAVAPWANSGSTTRLAALAEAGRSPVNEAAASATMASAPIALYGRRTRARGNVADGGMQDGASDERVIGVPSSGPRLAMGYDVIHP
jgi:hypothetical protein